MDLSLILIAVVVIFLIYIWIAYNGLVTARLRINEAWSQIDVQLKRRTDLIPNLVETVKGYAKHEKDLLENVTKARSALLGAKTNEEKAAANNELSETLKSIFAVSENYPDLKANQNFLSLQEELSDTENKIAYSRQFLNSNVLDYNTKLGIFPSSVIGKMFNFKPADFFQVSDADKEPVKVKF